VVAFSPEDCRALSELMDKALDLTGMQLVLEDSAFAYGEIRGSGQISARWRAKRSYCGNEGHWR
jgi:hypothetical protein